MWNRTLVYLGLREEPEEMYDEAPARFVPEDDPDLAADREPRDTRRTLAGVGGRDMAVGAAGAAMAAGAADHPARHDDNVRPLRLGDAGAAASRVAVVEVKDFDDVEAVGARYRTGQAVLFDLTRAERAVARRVVDFVAGLTYALRGELTKVGSRAFLLVPDGVELPSGERRRLGDLGYRLPTGSDA